MSIYMYRIWLSVFGAGYSPLIPGTCGSAVVAAVFLVTAWADVCPGVLAAVMLVLAAHGFVVTIVYGDRFIEEYGRSDPRQIVSDEQCGQAITFLWFWPMIADLTGSEILVFTAVGFVLFRIFDIIKPPPIRQLEKLKGAWGVLMDDVLAGVYAQIALQIFLRLGGLDWI